MEKGSIWMGKVYLFHLIWVHSSLAETRKKDRGNQYCHDCIEHDHEWE